MSERPATLLVSGWRFIPHSYAVVAEFTCLEFLRRAHSPQLFFEDRPYFNPAWRRTTGMLDAAAESALRALQDAPEGKPLDVEIRFSFPFELLRAPRAGRTIVFGSSEFLTVPLRWVEGGVPVRDAQRRHGYTILTPSQWAKQGFVRSGVPPDRVVVVPHGFDPALFRPAPSAERARLRAESGVEAGDFVFLNVGSMSSNKGPRYLLKAFAEVVRLRPQALLMLKGNDPLYGSVSLLNQELNSLDPTVAQLVARRLRYMGEEYSFAQMAHVYQAADCYVSPYVAEGFNMPVLEAAACGLPLICTAGGPTDDFVTERFALRIESKLLPIADPQVPGAMGLKPNLEHLVQLMIRAIDDNAFRDAASAAGPEHVRAHFTWEKVVDGLMAMIGGASG